MFWFLLFILCAGFLIFGVPILITRYFIKQYRASKAKTERIELEQKRKDEIRQRDLEWETEIKEKQKAEQRQLLEYKDRLRPQTEQPFPSPKYFMECEMEDTYRDIIVNGTEDLEEKSHLPKVKIDNSIMLKWDDSNDNIIIKVEDAYLRKLGYIDTEPELQKKIIDWIARKLPVHIIVSKVDESNIYLNITFYNSMFDKFRSSQTFRLLGTNNDDIGCYLGDYLIDNEVSFEYDCEKEKYAVLCDYEIGYLTDAIEPIIEKEHIALVSEVELNDRLMWKVKITIYYDAIVD
jgi:hypothetical protein